MYCFNNTPEPSHAHASRHPELNLAETKFDSLTRTGNRVDAVGTVRTSKFKLTAENTAGGLIGWMDVNGRPYPFVARAVGK